MTNINFFNQLAQTSTGSLNTGRMVGSHPRVFKHTFGDIKRKLNFKTTDNILDLGGGAGQITAHLASQVRHVVLADGAPSAIKLAKVNLRRFNNLSFQLTDITQLPLPFADHQFDKAICYSLVHYLDNYRQFENLIKELLRVTKPNSQILIADIPLKEKYIQDLEDRKKNPLKNFFLNQRYYLKKFITNLIYKLKGADVSQVRGLSYTKHIINQILNKFHSIEYKFLEQDARLPSVNSREDLLIIKKQ